MTLMRFWFDRKGLILEISLRREDGTTVFTGASEQIQEQRNRVTLKESREKKFLRNNEIFQGKFHNAPLFFFVIIRHHDFTLPRDKSVAMNIKERRDVNTQRGWRFYHFRGVTCWKSVNESARDETSFVGERQTRRAEPFLWGFVATDERWCQRASLRDLRGRVSPEEHAVNPQSSDIRIQTRRSRSGGRVA